ncbi:hypothetical protein FOZ63_016444 [Perkinsus olseni]|uniref:Uncharacterized protein n=1 Tax=Perkinsus olseni TaxID=32597 RepID=A0A7J6TM44_PEROL|nr:hypothetical protein FOZ60_012086 [Perkinsus olseni]KAF4746333.1 hypothetical protein FOZ63_016444 [Perkinsus olseni]
MGVIAIKEFIAANGEVLFGADGSEEVLVMPVYLGRWKERLSNSYPLTFHVSPLPFAELGSSQPPLLLATRDKHSKSVEDLLFEEDQCVADLEETLDPQPLKREKVDNGAQRFISDIDLDAVEGGCQMLAYD